MSDEWIEVKLGEILKIKHGYAFKGEYFTDKGKYILLTPGNFSEKEGLILKGDKEKYYIGEIPNQYILSKKDLIIAMTDLKQSAPYLGAPAIIDKDNLYLHNQRLGLITNLDENKINKGFLYWIFHSNNYRSKVRGSATGATVKHTAPERIYKILIKIPKSLETQKKIATILSNYDDLIENNNKRIEILEKQAKLIYEEWFVKFKFPTDEKVEFIGSELGRIPKGWEVKKFSNLFEIKYGKNLPTKNILKNAKYPVYGAGGSIGYYNEMNSKDKVTLITCRGNGSGNVSRTKESSYITNNSLLINSNKEYNYCNYSFIYYSLKNLDLSGVVTGSAQPQITINNINYSKFILPNKELILNFQNFSKKIIEEIDKLYFKNQNLRKTRDLLLPKLISGQIDTKYLSIK